MIVTEEDEDAVYLRGWEEYLHHSLVLRRGAVPAIDHHAFRVNSTDDLRPLAEYFTQRGCETRWVSESVGHGRALRVQDELGFPLEFFHEMEPVESHTRDFHLHRGAPILRFDHFNFHVVDADPAMRAWQDLGFRVTEYIASDGEDEKLFGAWLRRKSTVHDVALTAGDGPRLHHFAFWCGEPMAIMRACDEIAAGGQVAAIERGPGRHGVSNAFFVYLRDPDGHRVELYSCDYYTGDPDHPPLRWALDDIRCRSFWGTAVPDSWYAESSAVLDLDGNPIAVDEGADERSEVYS
jgi:3,4-dihydroxyphenylacetate 2,3-dioxygenase